jgi:acetyl-CoA C-acetyltransferase
VERVGYLPAIKRDYLTPLAREHGIAAPIHVYPLYENATLASWGQTPAQAMTESARLWAKMAAVAKENPNAWVKTGASADEIANPSSGNRPIAWPYPKLMVANPAVNQGGAILVTSLAEARALGIVDEKCIFVWGGAAAEETKDWLSRDRYTQCASQEAVLETILDMVDRDPTRFGFLELYSCFPVVPKMARRTLGLSEELNPSVAGGLTFHGAPYNNYMTHGIAAMVRALRSAPDRLGLVYGQGGHLTSHHALLLAGKPAAEGVVERGYDVNELANRRRGVVPSVAADTSGPATLETFTVLFRADGEVQHGVAVVRLQNGARSMGRVDAEDAHTLKFLMSQDASPIGLNGHLFQGPDSLSRWTL